MTNQFRPLPDRRVRLLQSLFKKRFDVNRLYIQSLQTRNLLQNHYLEAGLWAPMQKPEGIHWGWESPTSILIPDNEREFTRWKIGYRTREQAQNLRLIPLYEIKDESYTIYFPIRSPGVLG